MAEAPTVDGERALRVLFLNPTGILGGAERCLLDLIASMRATDPRVVVHVISATEGPLLAELERLGATAEVLAMPDALVEFGDSGLRGAGKLGALVGVARAGVSVGLATKRYAAQLSTRVAAFRPTIVHSNGLKFHLLSALGRSHGAPVVWHVRDLLSTRPLITKALRLLSGRVARTVAISELVRDDVKTVLPGTPVDVCYDAIDTDYFVPGGGDGAWLDAEAGLDPAPPGTVRVGLIATYSRWKGQDVFLRALARVVSAHEDVPLRCYVVGGPIYKTKGSQYSRDELRAMAEELGVADRVGLVGFQEDVAVVYRALDAVVHASIQPEPFGRTIAEAMSCARPVVVARESGAAELLGDDDVLRFAAGDDAALADAIRALATDAELRARLSARARDIAVAKFSRDRLGREMFEVYESLIGTTVNANRHVEMT